MVAAFPVAKLGAILIKQISKPLANMVKQRAKTSPFFRNYICMPPAQFYHWCEVRMRMWSMNLGKPMNIPKMNEANAIELGAELVGETVIFTIAAAILMAEYVRSSRKDAAKEEVRLQEMTRIQADLKELYFAKAKLEAEVNELIRVLHVNVNVPNSSFQPGSPNFESIPVHHREEKQTEEGGGIWAGITGIVWDAMELILPSEEESKDGGKTKETVSAEKTTESSSTSKSSSGSAPNTNISTSTDVSTQSSKTLEISENTSLKDNKSSRSAAIAKT